MTGTNVTQTEHQDIPGTRISILHRQGRQWACLHAGIDPIGGVTIASATTFDAGDAQGLKDWVEAGNTNMVRVVVPGSSIVCRTCSLPNAEPDQLDEALQLQAESKLLGTAPMFRTAAAMLPAPSHATTRTGLVLAWPETSDFIGPDLEPAPLYIPDVAAMCSLVGSLHPKAPALWVDREDGTVTMVMAQQERVHVRATKAHLPDPATTRECIDQLLMETALQAGSTPESSRNIATEASAELGDTTAPRTLQLPKSVLESMQERLRGCEVDQAWLDTWGIAAGAALAMSDDLAPLTMFQHSLPEETPSLGEFATRRLSSVEVAAALVLLAVCLLAIGPMAFHGTRVAMLSILHPGLGEQVKTYEDNRDQQVMYGALMSEAWPMSKLLADIASNTPEGIEVDSIRLGYGEPVRIQGMAMPSSEEESAALATRMKAMLQDSGVFSDVTLRWEDSETFGNRSFDISATVKRPQYRPGYALQQDFATWTLSERKSGQDSDGNWLDGTTAVASSTATPFDRGSSPSSTSSGLSAPPAPVGEPRSDPTTATRSATAPNRQSNSSRSPRTSAEGFSSRGDADDRAGDLSSVPTGTDPEPLSEEQIQAFTLGEAKIKLQEIAQARKRSRDPEAKARMKNEFNLLLKHMRELQREGGS